jgi:hypothetical protein
LSKDERALPQPTGPGKEIWRWLIPEIAPGARLDVLAMVLQIEAAICYISAMTKEQMAAVFERVRTWPEERQAHAAELLMLLEAQGEGPIRVSDDEWEAIQEGNAQVERGEFVSDEDMAAFYKRRGL